MRQYASFLCAMYLETGVDNNTDILERRKLVCIRPYQYAFLICKEGFSKMVTTK